MSKYEFGLKANIEGARRFAYLLTGMNEYNFIESSCITSSGSYDDPTAQASMQQLVAAREAAGVGPYEIVVHDNPPKDEGGLKRGLRGGVRGDVAKRLFVFTGEVVIVDSDALEQRAKDDCVEAGVVGFDLENVSYFQLPPPPPGAAPHPKPGPPALLQLAPKGKDVVYLYEVHKRGYSSQLRDVLALDEIIKVAVNIGSDVAKLRAVSITLNRSIDLVAHAKKTKLHPPPRSLTTGKVSYALEALVDHPQLLDSYINKAIEHHLWAASVMSPRHREYGATDARAHLEIYEGLERKMADDAAAPPSDPAADNHAEPPRPMLPCDHALVGKRFRTNLEVESDDDGGDCDGDGDGDGVRLYEVVYVEYDTEFKCDLAYIYDVEKYPSGVTTFGETDYLELSEAARLVQRHGESSGGDDDDDAMDDGDDGDGDGDGGGGGDSRGGRKSSTVQQCEAAKFLPAGAADDDDDSDDDDDDATEGDEGAAKAAKVAAVGVDDELEVFSEDSQTRLYQSARHAIVRFVETKRTKPLHLSPALTPHYRKQLHIFAASLALCHASEEGEIDKVDRHLVIRRWPLVQPVLAKDGGGKAGALVLSEDGKRGRVEEFHEEAQTWLVVFPATETLAATEAVMGLAELNLGLQRRWDKECAGQSTVTAAMLVGGISENDAEALLKRVNAEWVDERFKYGIYHWFGMLLSGLVANTHSSLYAFCGADFSDAVFKLQAGERERIFEGHLGKFMSPAQIKGLRRKVGCAQSVCARAPWGLDSGVCAYLSAPPPLRPAVLSPHVQIHRARACHSRPRPHRRLQHLRRLGRSRQGAGR